MALVVSCEPEIEEMVASLLLQVVGNRPPNSVKPSFGGPIYRPFSISLKANVICLDIVTARVKSAFGFPSCTSNSFSVLLLINVLPK